MIFLRPNATFMNRSIWFFQKACPMISKQVNLNKQISDVISRACGDIIARKLNDPFLLSVWQTRSGRQINMNSNEVMSVGIGIDCVVIRP